MGEHTPGPWWTDAAYREEEYGVAIIAANTDCGPLPGNPTRGMVAWASELLPENAAVCVANARLIAAAPELYLALELARTHCVLNDVATPRVMEKIDEALAKARGQSLEDSAVEGLL